MWPVPQQGYGGSFGYGGGDVRDMRHQEHKKKREREESSDSRGRHRRRDAGKNDKKSKREKDAKDAKRGEKEDAGRRDGGHRGDSGATRDSGKDGKDASRKHQDRGKESKEAAHDTRHGSRSKGGDSASIASGGNRRTTSQRDDDGAKSARSPAPPTSPAEKPPGSASVSTLPLALATERKREEDEEPSQKKAKGWRQEVATGEDERDLSTDDEGAEKKLAEARRRREAIAAKVAQKKDEGADKQAASTDGSVGGTESAQPKDAVEASIDSAGLASGGGSGGGVALGAGATAGTGTGEKGRKTGEKVSPAVPVVAGNSPAVVGQKATARKNEAEASECMVEGTSMFDDSAEAGKQLRKALSARSTNIGLTGASGDDWDDEEGYYIPKIGEMMDNRYLVVETCGGKGVFSNVVKAKDQQDKESTLVAIKIMRANDMMTKNAEREIDILERLNKTDKSNAHKTKHIIRLITTFAYRKHLCLVFECMADDLRAALKKYTKNKGMSMQAIRSYTQQLMLGLAHIHKCAIIHADIKPDNILLGKGQSVVKFCDLGTAVELKDISISPYLASRFYRAPEIIIGCEYSQAVDTWALACTLYELFTGKVLFSSKTNNDHLRKIMEIRGKMPVKVIKKGAVWKNHFNEELDFKHAVETTPSGEPVIKIITDLTAKKSVKDLIIERVGPEKRQSTAKEDQEYVKRAMQFADLLELMLALDPDKRIKPDDALNHAFLQEPKKTADKGEKK